MIDFATSERFKLWLSTIVASQITVWLGYFAAWGSIPFLGTDVVSSTIATFIASIVASAGASIFVIVMARLNRILTLLAEIAEKEKNSGQSGVKAIVMKTEERANDFESPLIVGPDGRSETNGR